MLSWSFYGTFLCMLLVQFVASIPWLFALFFRRDQVGSSFIQRLGTVVIVWLATGAIAAVFVAFQSRQSLETWGYFFAGVLQVQLTLDAVILAMAGLLLLWPKGGAVAQAAFREGVRQPMFWLIVMFAFIALSGAPIVPYFTFGEDYIMTKELGYDFIMLATVVFGVLAATLFVTDEIEGRTAITLMSKPISRRQFLLGKFVGIMLASALMFGILGFYFQDILLFKHWFDKDDPVAVPQWIAAGLVNLAAPADTTDFLRGIGMWTQHMLDTLPGLILSFCQVMVLVAFAVSFATRVPMVVNLVGVLTIFFLAHLSPVLVQIGAAAQTQQDESVTSQLFASTILNFAAQVFNTLLPALEFFRITPRLVGDQPPEAGPYIFYLASVFFYGILYTTIVLVFGLILFEDRDLA